MKKLRLLLVGLLITTTSFFPVSIANAGELSTAGASISWDESTFYEPSLGCTSYNFSYSGSNKVSSALIQITNKFNDQLGTAYIFGPNTGKISVQVCAGKDLTGTKVFLKVTGSATYGGTSDIVSTPITFLSRSSSPKASSTPAPAVSVTATPAPTKTVYITNPADKTLTDLVTSLKAQVSLLNAKVKKICSVKPKPKGC